MTPLTKPYFSNLSLKNISKSIKSILSKGNLINDKWTKLFEKKFTKLVGTKYALTTNTCTTSIQICLKYFNVKGKDVLVPSGSFQTNISAIKWSGGNPILVDLNPETLTFSLTDLEKKITKKTVGMIWVHVTGFISPEYKSIISFAKKNNLFIIEDCAHAHGAKIDNKMAGNIGDVGCFSFYPSKIITTGTGGMLTTNDVKLANYAKQMRFFGRNIRRRGVLLEGNDWFMDEIRACVGFHQMNDLKKILNRRRKIAKIYNFFFKKSKHIKLIYLPKNVEGTFYQYPIFIYNKQLRQKVIDQLKSKYKISTKKIWLPTHQEKIFEDLKFSKKTLLNTEKTFNNSICLPIYPEMTDQKTKDIAKKVLSIVENCV